MSFLRGFLRRLRDGEVRVKTCSHLPDPNRGAQIHNGTVLCNECYWYKHMDRVARDFLHWTIFR